MSFIIGTAGHVDHGKTSLVKALTGQDTDRLKEEKERGISIDLGFAHLDLSDGMRVGVIDVPGHERFIRNMMAGSHGVDLVVFVIAADDGVMPQTEEHFDIVELLGVTRAVFVIGKSDLVPTTRIAEVAEQIEILTTATALEGSPVIVFSSRTLDGLNELKDTIERSLKSFQKPAANGFFRLPIDRSFLLRGRGLVVTGTAVGGTIRVGDAVRCLPGNQEFRVRSIEVHGVSSACAGAGQRVALNLAGSGKDIPRRGDVISDPQLGATTYRFDAFVKILRPGIKSMRQSSRVHLHLGTSQRLGRMIMLDGGEGIPASKHLYCQLAIQDPLLVLRGDRFVIRDESGRRTIGGGVVVDPWAQKHRRPDACAVAKLETLRTGDLRSLAHQLVNDSDDFALPTGVIHQFLGLPAKELNLPGLSAELLAVGNAEEEVYTTAAKLAAVKKEVVRTLAVFHQAHPLCTGMDLEETRNALPSKITPKQFRAVIDMFVRAQTLVRNGSQLHLAAHRVRAEQDETSLMEKIIEILDAQKSSPPEMAELEKNLGIKREKLMELLRLLESEKAIVRIGTGLYLPANYAKEVRTLLCRYLANKGDISVATFRDLIGSSRKYTIPILEFFDREGTTKKVGDLRTLKSTMPTPH